MNLEVIVSIITSVLTIVSAIIGFYFKVKANIINKANELINEAESTKQVGTEKMAIVVDELYTCVPAVYRSIFTKPRLAKIVQVIFDCVEGYASKQKK